MFTSESRVEHVENGLKFYERDILMSSYVFNGSWTIDLYFDFIYPGFGIVLCDELKVIRLNNNGDDVSDIFGSYGFPYSEKNYYIGIYSSAGNILRDVYFSSGTPENWKTNINNTFGGRISFFDDGFKFENCLHDSEIEQSNVHLKTGTYYINYDTEIETSEREKYKALAVRYQNNKNYNYWFTTSEREIFDNSNTELKLENRIFDVSDAVQIYGNLPEAKVDALKLYRIPTKSMIHSIDMYADKYEVITQENYFIDAGISSIFVDADLLKKYQSFVVDYEKADTYALNFLDETGEYQVDISSSQKNLCAVYDMNENGVVGTNIKTNILPDKSKYIILRRVGD